MPVFTSTLDTGSDDFAKNRADMLDLIGQLRAIEQRAVDVSNKRKPVFDKRNQVPPRERLSRLLDPGMPFLRLHSLANYLVETSDPKKSIAGASTITGIGFVKGVRCLVWVDDSGINAGAMTASSVSVSLSVQEMAKRHKLPLVHCVESAGANLVSMKVELWAQGGAIFRNLAQLSAMGIPTIAILHGASTAGGAYMPGLSDYVIGVKNNGLAALGGAALVRAATGEEADDRQLGGSEMHAETTGLVEYLADDDKHALTMARDVVGRLGWNTRTSTINRQALDEPLYHPDEIAGLVPKDYRRAYDVRELAARLVDGSNFDEFKPRYGASTVCLQASIMGMACGIIGNNGPIDPQGATKAAQFFQLCDSADLPIIFLNNTTGYMVGTQYEQAGMIKHGSKMIQAVANVRVPKITLYVGASYGAGNYGMGGFGFEPDFLFAWPNSTSHVMGGQQAAKTMKEVMALAAKKRGIDLDEAALQAEEQRIVDLFSAQESAFYTSGRVLDHGIIDPRDSRNVLGFALETVLEGRLRTLKPNAFGVARL